MFVSPILENSLPKRLKAGVNVSSSLIKTIPNL
nr:MAG TPA: hypothetical protein [Bacteriophage sp.]